MNIYIAQAVDPLYYLARVLANELGPEYLPEARKAQALAAWSYVHYKLKVEGRNAVFPDTRDQAFDGLNEPGLADYEIAAQMMRYMGLYQGKPACMNYSRCCGGQTIARFGPQNRVTSCPCGEKADGHRCGGCQLGMERLALQGKSWEEIVAYYWNVDVVEGWQA